MVFTVCNKAVKYFTKFLIFTLVLLLSKSFPNACCRIAQVYHTHKMLEVF